MTLSNFASFSFCAKKNRLMRIEFTQDYIENLKEIIENKNDTAASALMAEAHAADIAEIYDELSIDQAKYLFLLIEDREKAADVLAELDDDDRERFMSELPSDVIASKFIDHMDSDDAADVLADLSEETRDEVLKHVKDLDQAGDIVDLLNYDEDTAGGLMQKELVVVDIESTVASATLEIRRQAEGIEHVFYVYVNNKDNILQGALSLKRLLLASPEQKIKDILVKDIISVRVDMSAEEAAKLAQKYDLIALPVVDSIGRLLGRITIDDLVDVLREEADHDYQLMSGLSQEVEHSDSVFRLTRARLPWLFVGLIGGILAARVIGVFEHSLAENAAMAFFIPLIAAMGGNVGVQSSSIVVQGLANNSFSTDSTFNKIIKEILVASVNGVALAGITFVFNLLTLDSMALTVAVSISLFAVIIIASVIGTFIPLLLHRLKIDPALATGPFITSANDILGLFIYLAISGLTFHYFH